MNQPNKERFKTSVGGQALMEGIMMRGPKNICCAVRNGHFAGAPVKQQTGCRFHHQGVSGGGLLGTALHQEIGF